MIAKMLAGGALLSALAAWAGSVAGADTAAVFMYHHVDVGTPPSTSVAPARFRAHLDYLDHEGFNVVPLLEVLVALRDGRAVPDRTVVITFDDGYASVLTTAAPELERRGWPFTVFVSTGAIDSGYGGYLSWDEVRALVAAGATIGNHTVSHAHLPRREAGEREADWRRRIEREISGAAERLEDEVSEAAIPVLAYPYGEYDLDIKSIVADLGLFAFGQQSGAIGPSSDWLALPRYPLATGFDELDDLALRARTRPLPVSLIDPERHTAAPGEDRPALRLELPARGDFRRAELACYASGQGRMILRWLDADETRFAITPERGLRPGRTKYNCTAPSATEPGVYHWYGYLWMTQNPDGSWYAE